MIVPKNLAEKEGNNGLKFVMLPETQVQINAHVALCYMSLETAYKRPQVLFHAFVLEQFKQVSVEC